MLFHHNGGTTERGTFRIVLRGRGEIDNTKVCYLQSLSGGKTYLSSFKIGYKIDTTNKNRKLEILAYIPSTYTTVIYKNTHTRGTDMLLHEQNPWKWTEPYYIDNASSVMQSGVSSGFTEFAITS